MIAALWAPPAHADVATAGQPVDSAVQPQSSLPSGGAGEAPATGGTSTSDTPPTGGTSDPPQAPAQEPAATTDPSPPPVAGADEQPAPASGPVDGGSGDARTEEAGSGGSGPPREGDSGHQAAPGGRAAGPASNGPAPAASSGLAQPAAAPTPLIAPATANSLSLQIEPTLPGLFGVETGGLGSVQLDALACRSCYAASGLARRFAGIIGGAVSAHRLEHHSASGSGGAQASSIRLFTLTAVPGPLTRQLLSLLGGGGGGAAAFLLLGLVAVLTGLVLRVPGWTKALRLPAVTWPPPVYPPPIEHPG